MFFISNSRLNEKIEIFRVNDNDPEVLTLMLRDGTLVYRSERNSQSCWNGQPIGEALINAGRRIWGEDSSIKCELGTVHHWADFLNS